MQRKFATNLIILLTLNLLIKPFWVLGIDRTVQNILGAETYGLYYAIFNFSFLFNILLDLGITNFNNRNIAQNNHLLRKHLSNIIVLKLLLGIIYLVFTVAFGLLIKYSWKHIFLLLLLSFNQFLVSFILYVRSNISGLHLFKIDSLLSVLDRFLMIIFCGIILLELLPIHLTIEVYVLCQTLSYIITALIALIIIFKKASTRFMKLNWNFPFFLMIIKNSFPFAILVLLMTFYNRIDTVMMERMLPDGAEQSGYYASAYRILDATNMIAYLFATLLLPIFSRMLKLREPIENLVTLSYTLIIIPAIIISYACYFFSNELMDLMYHAHVSESSEIFRVLMFCFIPISTTYIFGTLLTANGNLKHLNIVAAAGMLLNIILNIFLIPKYKALGSSYASLITQTLTSLTQVFIAYRIFKLKINILLLLKFIAFIICVFLFGKIIYLFEFSWFLRIAIFVAISSIFAFIVRLLDIKSFIRFITRN